MLHGRVARPGTGGSGTTLREGLTKLGGSHGCCAGSRRDEVDRTRAHAGRPDPAVKEAVGGAGDPT